MSSDDDEEYSGPPPARHDTGTFERPELSVAPTQSTGVQSPSGLSPTSYSSFRWDRAQSFRLYAVNSRALMRRQSQGLSGSMRNMSGSQTQLDGSVNSMAYSPSIYETPKDSPQQPGSFAVGDDPKSVMKSCYETLKSYILAHGSMTSGAGIESTLPSNLRKGPRIGAGGYATVFCGVNLTTGELVAIKEIQVSGTKATNPMAFSSVQDEFALLRRLRHRNVIQYQLFEYSISQKLCRIVMEFCAGGSSQEMLQKFGTIPESILKHFAGQILAGLEFIHAEGIIHRDIKPANILMHANGVIKLADFGCSKKINEISESTSHVLGTPVYMAPEYIKGKIHRKSDVWAVGCTLLELVTGKPPWHHTRLRDNLAQMFHISTSYESPQIPYADISNEMSDFLAKCFDRNVDTRPEAGELLKHPWLTLSAEDAEGLAAIEEIGADQFSVLVEQLCVTDDPLKKDSNLSDRGTTVLGSPKHEATHSHGPEDWIALSTAGSGVLHVGASVMSRETSASNTPDQPSICIDTVELEGESTEPTMPTGPMHMELPIDMGGRTMKLELEVKPEDLSVKVLNRRKSYVVNLTDGIREQIHAALEKEAEKGHALSESQNQTLSCSASLAEPTGW
jgi:serine/threonine protein kinase